MTRDDVLRAAETIRDRVRRTPTLDGSALVPGLGLKAELLQHTGSFKARGVVNRLSALGPQERERGVAGASAGNHAIALAWGAAAEGLDCVVFTLEGREPVQARARAGCWERESTPRPTTLRAPSSASKSISARRARSSSTRSTTRA